MAQQVGDYSIMTNPKDSDKFNLFNKWKWLDAVIAIGVVIGSTILLLYFFS